jgi:hypothetical protein
MTYDDEECIKRIEELEEENAHLRRAAEDFGQLAERLNNELIEEKRRGGDRRRQQRETPERRKAASNAS